MLVRNLVDQLAVMEGSISSSLAHPNICTTYTYSIKPYVDETMKRSVELGTMVMMPSTEDSIAALSSDAQRSQQHSLAHLGRSVHAYEVRLVIEYCDKGSLREVRDQKAIYKTFQI